MICDVESGRLKQTVRDVTADIGAFTATGKALVFCQCYPGAEKPLPWLGPQPLLLGRLDLATGKSQVVCQRQWAGAGPAHPAQIVVCVAISSDGETVAVPDPGGTVVLLDTLTGKTRRVLQGPPNNSPACMQFSPDGTRLAEGTKEGSVIVWFLADSAPTQPSTTEALVPSPLRLDQRRRPVHDRGTTLEG